MQEKKVLVFTDERPQPFVLTLRATIPAWVEASPRVLWWEVGEAATEKVAVLTVNSDADIRMGAVKSHSTAMQVTLRPGEAPGVFRLVVRPESTAVPVQGTVSISLELVGAAPRTFTFFAQVR